MLCEPLVGNSCSLLLASRGASLVLERYASFRQCKAICRFLLIEFNSLVELFSLNAIRHCGFRLWNTSLLHVIQFGCVIRKVVDRCMYISTHTRSYPNIFDGGAAIYLMSEAKHISYRW